MKLIGTTSSPFARKVRVVALEKGIPLEFVIDPPLEAGSKVPSLNPLGKVPVLVRDDGSTLIDSPLIVEYLESLVETPQFFPVAFEERMAVRQWEAIADGVIDAAVLVRMENLRPEKERSAAWTERQQGKIERGLAFMELGLGGKEFCVGANLTLADVAVGCCVGYLEFRFPGGGWRGRYPELARMTGRLHENPSFRATLMV